MNIFDRFFNRVEQEVVVDPYSKCRQCKKFKTSDCPNSFYCFSRDDKPDFEKKESK